MARKKSRAKKVSNVTNKPDIIENPDGSITMKFNMGSARDINGRDYSRIILSNVNVSPSFSDGIQHPVSLKEDGSIDDKKPLSLSNGGFINTFGSGSTGRVWVDEYSEYHNETWTRLSPGEIFIPSHPNNINVSPFNKREISEPSERYWSGGTNEETGGDGVDIFIDQNEMTIGISRDGNGVTLPVGKEDVYKLIRLLQEAVSVSGQWDQYLKQSSLKREEGNGLSNNSAQDNNSEQARSKDDDIY